MKLIVGLGNPGKKYQNNRHNVGHLVVEALQESGLPQGVFAEKTDVFMNVSGETVRKLANFYKISPENLYIIHDDLDIPLGEYKIQKGKGPKLHYGIQSIEESLGTPDFWRVRVGVDNRDPNNRIPGENYVLQDFTQDERGTLKEVIGKINKFAIRTVEQELNAAE